MPVDPSVQAASLVASTQEISPIERQNRFGVRHQVISNLTSEKVVTILAVQTSESFSSDQFFEILEWLRANYAVESMQTAFVADVTNFGDEYRNDLHLTAHLRIEAVEPLRD